MMSTQTILGLWSYRVPRGSFRDHLERLEKITPVWTKILGMEQQRHKFQWAIWEAAVTVCMNSPFSQSCDHIMRHSMRPQSLWDEHKGKTEGGKRWFTLETRAIYFLSSTKQKQLHAAALPETKRTNNWRKTNTCFLRCFFFLVFFLRDARPSWRMASGFRSDHPGERTWLGLFDTQRFWMEIISWAPSNCDPLKPYYVNSLKM